MRYEDVDWTLASCIGVPTDVFYPETQEQWWDVRKTVKDMCNACRIKSDCLQYAIEYEKDNGMFAGTTPRDRRDMNKTRRKVLRNAG